MNKISPIRVNAEIMDVPIARLDVQDAEQSLPLREYLEQNGVAVVMGRKPAIEETYHFICGDQSFVKDMTATLSRSDIKPFVVLFLNFHENIPTEFLSLYAKIAAVSGSSLETRDVHKLFAYFITGEEKILHIENSPVPMMELKPVAEVHDHESLMSDTDRVSHVLNEMFHSSKESNNYKPEKRKSTSRRVSGSSRGFTKYVCIFFSTVIAPMVWYFVCLSMVALLQWYGIQALKKGDVSRLKTVAGVSRYWVRQGRGALAFIGTALKLFGAGGIIRTQERVLGITDEIVYTQEKTADLTVESSSFIPLLFSGLPTTTTKEDRSILVLLDRMRLVLDDVTNSLGLAGAQLHLIAKENQFPFNNKNVKSLTHRVEAEINATLAQAGSIRNLLTLYRAVGGFDRKKTYLILLQNSMELRPTGGFIGSIATVTIDAGRFETPVVQDVYVLDGQLKGHVDPPVPIKDVLKQEHWYLRDSNWDPDFGKSGQKAAWFYEKETGQVVDGVIALSTPVLTNLLGVTGPLNLPDYSDRITKENFFGKSLFYTKADFFPGSTQKKDFLGSVTLALINKLSSGKPGDATGIMKTISDALTGGDIQFWFPDKHAQAIVEQAQWAGEIARPELCLTLTPSCMVDRVAFVEANLGVNKVNAYIKRSVKSRADVGQDGVVDGTIVITYQNASSDDSSVSGGGTYLAYVRAILPADASILSVSLDGLEITEKNIKAKEPTIPYRDPDETTQGSTIAGFTFSVPAGTTRSITTTYRRGTPFIFTDNEGTFVYSMRKQPGTIETSLDLAIGYPQGWKTETEGMAGLLANAREVRYNTTLDKTKVFTVKFKKE